ncbi:MAG: DUF4232 domain-containing protein [Actinomycetales bacterium]|nr:DUF4232 domain-containing protein [Actinomycetales bacterium]
MTRAEEQLSRLLAAAAPDGTGVAVDDVASMVRRRRQVRETGVAVATVLAAVATVVGIAVVTPRSPAAPSPPAVDLTGTVPWSDARATPYVPPEQPSPSADARPCTAADVTATAGESDGAGGRLVRYIELRNTGSSACLLQGYPQVTAIGDGLPDVEATQGSFFPGTGAADMQPGEVTTLGIETTTECQALVSGAVSGPWPGLRITLPDGGGTVDVEVPEGVDALCGLKTSEFSGPTPTLPAVADPLASLRASLELPATFVPGEPLVYVVRLTNPTDAAIALDRCPSYLETLTGATTHKESHALACAAAGGEIGPHLTVAFEMRLAVPADAQTWLALSSHQPPSWPVTVTWSLTAPFDVSATAALTLVDAASTDAPTATATGVLELVGGPATTSGTTPRRGTAGTVTFTDDATSTTYSATAASDGTFSLDVPPGTYTVAGTPTDWSSPCAQGDPVDVPAGGASGIDVICSIP